MNVVARPARQLLPNSYVEAKQKLAVCARVDECKSWADKALALESYAKQMRDTSLAALATKIRDRALQRGGQLLLKLQRQKGRNQHSAPGDTKLKTAIKDAGLSKKQADAMMRVARVPETQFDALVENNNPASAKQLAELGTKKAERIEPNPYGKEISHWVNAVEDLSALPACGLDTLMEHNPYPVEDLLAECRAAIPNLKLWLNVLEKAYGRQKTTIRSAG